MEQLDIKRTSDLLSPAGFCAAGSILEFLSRHHLHSNDCCCVPIWLLDQASNWPKPFDLNEAICGEVRA
jgi:hypothetical protein